MKRTSAEALASEALRQGDRPGRTGRRPGSENYEWTEALEAELLRLAETKGPAVAKAHFQAAFRIHPKAVDRKLKQLCPGWCRRAGCSAKTEEWDGREELQLSELLQGTATVTFIAQRLSNLNGRKPVRSEAAVRSKIWRSERDLSLPGYKVADVTELLGVRDRQVRRWIENGYLATKAGRVTEESLLDLLKHRGRLIPFDRLSEDQQELLLCHGYRRVSSEEEKSSQPRIHPKVREKILAGAEAGLTHKEVAMLLGVSVRIVRRWKNKGLLRAGARVVRPDDLRELVNARPELLTNVPARIARWLREGKPEPR